MTASPLLDIFKHLTKQDRRALQDFVNSPFHNKRKEVILLFEYINKNLDAPLNLKKETVFTHVFQGLKPMMIRRCAMQCLFY